MDTGKIRDNKGLNWVAKDVWKYLLQGEKKMAKYATQELKEATEKLLEEKHTRLEEIQRVIQDTGGSSSNNIRKMDKLQSEIRSLQEQLERLSAVESVENVFNEIHQYIPLAKDIFGKAKVDFSIVIKMLVNAGIDIAKGLDGEISTISKLSAKRLFQGYEDLCKAGFTKDEAFRIILARIKPINFSEILNQTNRSASSIKS